MRAGALGDVKRHRGAGEVRLLNAAVHRRVPGRLNAAGVVMSQLQWPVVASGFCARPERHERGGRFDTGSDRGGRQTQQRL